MPNALGPMRHFSSNSHSSWAVSSRSSYCRNCHCPRLSSAGCSDSPGLHTSRAALNLGETPLLGEISSGGAWRQHGALGPLHHQRYGPSFWQSCWGSQTATLSSRTPTRRPRPCAGHVQCGSCTMAMCIAYYPPPWCGVWRQYLRTAISHGTMFISRATAPK